MPCLFLFGLQCIKTFEPLSVNVDSVVDLVVYMYILLCFLVLYVVSVGLLHVVNPVEVYYGI